MKIKRTELYPHLSQGAKKVKTTMDNKNYKKHITLIIFYEAKSMHASRHTLIVFLNITKLYVPVYYLKSTCLLFIAENLWMDIYFCSLHSWFTDVKLL